MVQTQERTPWSLNQVLYTNQSQMVGGQWMTLNDIYFHWIHSLQNMYRIEYKSHKFENVCGDFVMIAHASKKHHQALMNCENQPTKIHIFHVLVGRC